MSTLDMSDPWRYECDECGSRRVRRQQSTEGFMCENCRRAGREHVRSRVVDVKTGSEIETDATPPREFVPQRSGGGDAYSERELLRHLRAVATDVNGVPQRKHFAERAGPSWSAYRNHFGGLREAREQAGLKRRHDRTTYSEEELIEHLQEIDGRRAGGLWKAVDAADGPSKVTYSRRFGGLPEAREKAGVTLDE